MPAVSRQAYHRQYHAEHREEAALRKGDERDRRDRCRSYWYARLVLGREMPALIRDVSEELLESERLAYLALLDEPCEVVHVPADVVKLRNVTTGEDAE